MQKQPLPLGSEDALEFLLLVLPLQEGLAGDRTVRGDLLQPGDLSLHHVQFFGGAEVLRLALDDLLVRQPQIEQRLARA